VKATVTTQPAQIYPFGVQPTMLLTNDGPGTIYLGDDSTVSADYGVPLPPLAMIPWEDSRSLWAVSKSTSFLKYTRTLAAPTTPGDGKQRTLFLSRELVVSGVARPVFECGSYQSLVVTYVETLSTGGFGSVAHFDWYSSDDVFLQRTTYESSPPDALTSPVVMRIPVQGSSCIVTVDNNTSFILVMGSTINTEARLTPQFSSGSLIDVPARISGFPSAVGDWSNDYANLGWTMADPIYLHTLGRQLTVTLNFSGGAPTTTGSLRLIDVGASGTTFGFMPIVVGTALYSQTFPVPLGMGYKLQMAPAPATILPSVPVSLVWS